MAEAAQIQSDDWKDIPSAEAQASPYSHGDDWHDIVPPPASYDEFAGPKVTETPLYKAGESIQKTAREAFPVSEERAAHPYASAIGRGAGAMLPAVAATLAAGPAGVMAGAAQMGMSSGADVFDDALSKGATEEQAAKAAGATGALSAAIGVLPLGSILAPIRQKLPGMAGWAVAKLTQAAVNGVTFATVGEAQQWLTTEVEKAYYDPNAHYDPQFKDMLASFIVGGAFGTMHPLRRPGEAPGRPAEASLGEVLPPERGAAPAGPSVREAPTIEGEAVGVPRPAERRPEGLPPPARALPPPGEAVPAAMPQAPRLDLTPGIKARGQDEADALKRRWAAESPIQSKDDLFAGAHENQADLVALGNSIATDLGVDFRNPGVKGPDRVQEKIDQGKHPGRINDVVRAGFAVERPNQAEDVIGRLSKKYPIIDEGWAVTPSGYFDRKVIVRFPNGQAGEVQLWHPDLLREKEENGHKLYVEARSLPDGDPRKAELERQQSEIYMRAMAAADPEWKAVLGNAGIAGNLVSKADLDSTRPPIATSDELTRRQDPSTSAQASPGTYTKGSPSSVPNVSVGAINRNISPVAPLDKSAALSAGQENVSGADREAEHSVAKQSGAKQSEAEAAPLMGAAVSNIKPHRVTAADGTAIDVVPRVVEADQLITSQDAGYDQSLQPRQRSRAASQQQIRSIATSLDPGRLGYSAEADRGAPIVSSDGTTESGNGRVLAIRRVYDQGGQKADAYRNWVAQQGVDVSVFKQPILVRQRLTELTPEQRRAFTVASNQPTTLAMSASERAMADARLIDSNALNLLVNPDDLSRNKDFIRRFVGQLPQTEQGAMADAHGALSSEGATRIRNAVLAKAYGDAGILTRIAESTNDEIKSISNALVTAAPRWARMRAEVEAGNVRRDVDATPDLIEAVKRTSDIRDKGQKLKDYLAQQDAFDRLSDTAEAFMRMFYTPEGGRAAAGERIKIALRAYAEEAAKVSSEKGLNLGLVPVTQRDILGLAQKKEWEGYGRQGRDADRNGAGAGPREQAGGDEAPGPFLTAGGEGAGGEGVEGNQGEEVRAQRPERNLIAEREREGQLGLLGTERVTSAQLAQRRANEPLRPRVAQEPPSGLFAHQGQQLSLEDFIDQVSDDKAQRPEALGNEDLAYLLGPKSSVGVIGKETGTVKPNGVSLLTVANSPEGYEGHRLVYSKDGKIVGAMQVMKAPNVGHTVANTFVDPAYRRQGIATALNTEAEKRFGELSRSEGPSQAGDAFRASLARDRAQTDTPEFRRWFGDSKVVDANGQPQVMYHGTKGDIGGAFEHTKRGSHTKSGGSEHAFFFTSKPSVAETYAEKAPRQEFLAEIDRLTKERDTLESERQDKISSPKMDWSKDSADLDRLDDIAYRDHDLRLAIESLKHHASQSASQFYPPNIEYLLGHHRDIGTERAKELAATGGESIYPTFLRVENPVTVDAAGKVWHELPEPMSKTIADAKAAGHDGVIFKDIYDPLRSYMGEEGRSNVVAVFEPEQIKSAIGNSGTFDPASADIRAKTPTGWEAAEGHGEPKGEKIRIGRDTYAYVNPKYSAKEQEIAKAVMEIGARMAPKANVKGVAALRQSGATIWGGFINSPAFPQLIAWSLEKGDAGKIGQTVRHEVIHHLKNLNLFSPAEWKALETAAIHDGWLQRHHIYDRYGDLPAAQKVEEAICEQFGKWRSERSLVKPGPVRSAFMRMDLFLRRVTAAVRRVLGFNAVPEDIFTAVELGTVGRRELFKKKTGGRVQTTLRGKRDDAINFVSKHSEANRSIAQ